MANYVTLIGAEEVSRAGYTMRDSAERMNSAASYFENVFQRHEQFMDDWLQRFEQVADSMKGNERGE